MARKMTEGKILQKLSEGELDSNELADYAGRSYAVDRAIAAAPNASSDLLRKLAQSGDWETRRNVVCNVGTPADTLIPLAKEFPKEFFEHSLLDLMILEDPLLLTRLEPGVLKSFLNDPACPDSFVLWACRHGHKTDQLEILKRTNLSADQLKYIARGPHPKAAERAIDRLIEMGESW